MTNFKFKNIGGIEDLFVVESKKFADERGYFIETYNENEFLKFGLDYNFVQDNQSYSKKGVIRGLHFQINYPQAKLVRVLSGEIYDVAIDLRKNSQTYGSWYGIVLSETNNLQLMIPRGFAHGFQVISENAVVCYKCDDLYHPGDEGGVAWDDKDLSIDWPLLNCIILSNKDKDYPSLRELEL